MSEQYWVRLNPYEEEHLERNNMKFSEFVHKAFYKDMKTKYVIKKDKIGLRLGLMLFGMLIVALSYVTINLLIWVALILTGIYLISFGLLSIIWELSNGRKRVYD